jgi:hypothetical protein
MSTELPNKVYILDALDAAVSWIDYVVYRRDTGMLLCSAGDIDMLRRAVLRIKGAKQWIIEDTQPEDTQSTQHAQQSSP